MVSYIEINEKCKIYKLTNKTNGKIYIGQTWMELEDRMGRNGNGYSNSPYLFAAIQKYGYSNFEYEILSEHTDQKEADDYEAAAIIKFNSKDNSIGYNIKDGGRGGKHSEESKKKISVTLTGRIFTISHRKNLSNSGTGVKKRLRTEDEKEFISQWSTNWHANNPHPLLGIPRTEKQKLAQSLALKGKPRDPDAVERGNAKLREMHAMTEEQELEIINLYLSGLSINEVSKKLSINNRKIYRAFKKHNIESRKKSSQKIGTKDSDEVR